jgi:hypothetical protein
MNYKFDIPEALKPNFQRVYRRVPVELRQNETLIKDLILFLKVGGERLARQQLEVAKNDLKLVKTVQRKERRREAMRRTAAAAAENAAADNDEAAVEVDAADEENLDNGEVDIANDDDADLDKE